MSLQDRSVARRAIFLAPGVNPIKIKGTALPPVRIQSWKTWKKALAKPDPFG